jgi:hypothetical protein
MTTILKNLSVNPHAIEPNAIAPVEGKPTQPVFGSSKRIFSWLSFPNRGVYASAQEPIQEALLNNSNLLLI